MFKSKMTVFALFIIFIAGGPVVVGGETEVTMDAIFVPVGRLVLAPPVGVTPKKSAVAFPHSLHFDYTCKTCHHKWDGNSRVQSCTASQCHDQLSSAVKHQKAMDKKAQAIRYYKNAFHQQCIICHKEIKTINEKLERSGRKLKEPLQQPGPIGCIGCHPRH